MNRKRKYRSAPVDGSVAYDLASPRVWPDYEYAPVDIPAAEEREDAVVKGRHLAAPQAMSPVAVIGFAIAAVLLIVSLMARISLTTVSAECVKMEQSIAALEASRSKLLIAYESAFNLAEIEEYAIDSLGMQKPRSDQIIYISGDAQDRAVLLSRGEELGFADRLGDFFSTVTSYFSRSQ